MHCSFFPSRELTCVTFDPPCLHFGTPDGTKQLPSLVSCPLLTCNRSAGPPGWNWWRSCVPLRTWLSNQFIPIPENGGEGDGLITSISCVFLLNIMAHGPLGCERRRIYLARIEYWISQWNQTLKNSARENKKSFCIVSFCVILSVQVTSVYNSPHCFIYSDKA